MFTASDVVKTLTSPDIPLCVPYLDGNEWAYVKECLDTSWISSSGDFVDRFEAGIAAAAGVRYGVATMNGTSALHIALLLAGVERGDEVLVSDLTFIAPANAVTYVGAHPVFVDAERDYWQMDAGLLGDFLERQCRSQRGQLYNKETGRRIGAILPVHILGHPVDMDPIVELARMHGLPVIEDATESIGALYRDRQVGSLGDMACFSFNGNKLLSTGGGGMLVTDRQDWAERGRYLTTQSKDDPVEYIHEEIGFNYRLTNVLAAIGCAQVEQLKYHLERKRGIALRYREAFHDVPQISPMPHAPWATSAFWMYTVLLEKGMDRRRVRRELAGRNIQTRPLWQPMHLSPAHRGAQHIGEGVSIEIRERALSLPCSVGLTQEQQERTIAALIDIVNR